MRPAARKRVLYGPGTVMPLDLRNLSRQRIIAVLNTGSGSCDEGSSAKLSAIMTDAGVAGLEIVCVGPAAINAALDDAVVRADLLIVLGGDGTIGTAAAKCEAHDTLLLPLPGGTMNMLPRALYGSLPWEGALAATLADPEIREVSGGKAEGRPFYCVAILGAPSLWADAREALRAGDLVEAAKRSVTATRRSLQESRDYQFGDGVSGSAEAVAVICPAVSAAMPSNERALEAAALDPKSAADAFRLVWHAAYDGWRHDASVTVSKVDTLRVTGHGQVPVILDGEKVLMGRSVRISFTPLAFRALVPAERARGASGTSLQTAGLRA
jgi:diacylglycerol kinase family enzyme